MEQITLAIVFIAEITITHIERFLFSFVFCYKFNENGIIHCYWNSLWTPTQNERAEFKTEIIRIFINFPYFYTSIACGNALYFSRYHNIHQNFSLSRFYQKSDHILMGVIQLYRHPIFFTHKNLLWLFSLSRQFFVWNISGKSTYVWPD